MHEIQDDFRTLRDGHRRRSNDTGQHRRLSDDELDDFRRGVGEEASWEREEDEFEMHERQANAYRERLRASMSESLSSGTDRGDRGLRRRRAPGVGDEEAQVRVPVLDVRTPTSPELPHHSLGDVSPTADDVASLPSNASHEETIKSDSESDAAKNGLLGLDFGQQQAPPSITTSSDVQRETLPTSDPFVNIVDGTASSWHAVFTDRPASHSAKTTTSDNGSIHQSSRSFDELTDEGHVILDTNGLSQTPSDQQLNAPDSPYNSNRALQPPSHTAPSTGSRSNRTDSEPDFEVLSDTAESEGRWSYLHAPPSPTISTGSEPMGGRGIDVFSDGEDSWAELSAGSDVEGERRVVRS